MQFRREEITPLGRFPSACLPPPRGCRSRRSLFRRWLVRPAAIIAVFLLVAGTVFYAVGVDAIGNERLRLQAEQAIERLAGVDVDVSIGSLHLGLGRTSLFALEVRDAEIIRADDKRPIAEFKTLRFGLRAIPLLSGRIELARVAMADALLTPAEMSAGTGPTLTEFLARPSPIGPEELRTAIFDAIDRAFEITRGAGLSSISLSNVGLLAGGRTIPGLLLESFEITRSNDTDLALEGAARYRGRDLTFEGRAHRDPNTNTLSNVELKISAPEGEEASSTEEGLLRSIGAFDLALSGKAPVGKERGFLRIDVAADGILLDFGDDELALDRASVGIAAGADDDVFSVLQAQIQAGRTRINLQGTFGPETVTSGAAGYRMDLVSRDSVLAPADSPEAPLPFAMRLQGRFDPATMQLTADPIDVRSAEGELNASAELTLAEGKSPGIKLNLQVSSMPAAHVKQFWPWFAAPGARNWTLENVFGGTVRDSGMTLEVPPGRLGNGVPLGPKEVFGRFALSDTRFNIAGEIPPVRDADGYVEFHGTDVKVGLSSGRVYMASGRTVDAKDGTLTIDASKTQRRIGNLEINVAGEAPAILEFVSYRPIAASRFYDLQPDDLKGKMSGHVSAEIPLQAGIALDELDWRVALDYENLSVAKPFEGQQVTDAKGSLLVEPTHAEFRASAKLNGIPADLHIVEPFGHAQVEKVRHVELKMDDTSREKLFPGLGTLVSGPFTLVYDREKDNREKVSLKLDSARLDVPWIGWRKGAGIPAMATFHLKRDGQATELSDFSLVGESFSLAGHIRLNGPHLQEASFQKARFNRGDDFSATIRRNGNGYSVSVKGAAFDARALIKQVFGNRQTSGAGNGDGDATPVSVKASLAQVSGFGGETLSQVEFTYASDGRKPDELTLGGATRSHGGLKVSKTSQPGTMGIHASSSNAGAVFRFLDFYEHMEGGQLSVALQGANNEALAGQIDIRDFWIVNEPKMRSLVAATKENGRVDTTRVYFESGAAALAKGRGSLNIAEGVVRGPVIGSTFQGMLYDPNDRMDLTGTFMPLYGVNRIFGELPLIGQILGNGRDRGLIGITFRLSGAVENPRLEVNPLSAVAPGFLREIFEFR
uniref:YhdP central domain-containing protein n=1 Tax=Chelativorans sp. (strain BNC1) TaxID=266779 RepID=Q11HE5_CHESB